MMTAKYKLSYLPILYSSCKNAIGCRFIVMKSSICLAVKLIRADEIVAPEDIIFILLPEKKSTVGWTTDKIVAIPLTSVITPCFFNEKV